MRLDELYDSSGRSPSRNADVVLTFSANGVFSRGKYPGESDEPDAALMFTNMDELKDAVRKWEDAPIDFDTNEADVSIKDIKIDNEYESPYYSKHFPDEDITDVDITVYVAVDFGGIDFDLGNDPDTGDENHKNEVKDALDGIVYGLDKNIFIDSY